ncbi:MAG: Crp/Fnr family transcriptional regulator [Cyanobacteria bacterium P01_A01_bin.84]
MSEDFHTQTNRILLALLAENYQRLEPHLEYVYLNAGIILSEPGEPMSEVYFPNSAMISLVSIMEDGSTTEIAIVGNEGMVGLPVVLGGETTTTSAMVQISGIVTKLDANILKQEFHHGGQLQKLLLLYTQALLTQVAQNAACNRQHTIVERLARWLLSVQNCVKKDELLLTQEFISQMLGIRRSGVTVAAGTLQKAGIIRYSRGKITIINQEDLEATACECYCVVEREFIRLLG